MPLRDASLSLLLLGVLAALVACAPDEPARPASGSRPGYLGFHLEPNPLLEPERRDVLGVKGTEGSVVAAIVPGGPAEAAGLRLGDRLVRFAGQPVPDPQTLTPKDRRSHHEWRVAIREMLEGREAGETVDLVVDRAGTPVTLEVTAIDADVLRAVQRFGVAERPLPPLADAGPAASFALRLGPWTEDPTLPQGLYPWEGHWELAPALGVEPPVAVLRQDRTTLPWAVLLVAGKGRAIADGKVSVRWLPHAGVTDASGGIVFRAQGGRDYYVARGNALEANLRIYVVKDGVRTELASVDDIPLPALDTWSTLEVAFRGDTFTAVMNGTIRVEAKDPTWSSGWTGLWTKADSVTLFDGYEVEPVASR